MDDRGSSWLQLISYRMPKADCRSASVRCRPLLYLVTAAMNLVQRPPHLLQRCLPRRYARDVWKAMLILAAFFLALLATRRNLMGENSDGEDRIGVQKIGELQRVLDKVPSLWPAPRQLNVSLRKPRVLDARRFRITADADCDVVRRAIRRYRKLVLLPTEYGGSETDVDDTAAPAVMLTRLHVKIRRHRGLDCGYPPPKPDESYLLKIPPRGDALLTSETVWGALRGLETFSQMLQTRPFMRYATVCCGTVHDFPRFSHRGVLLDTARHFLPVPVIKQNLDAMAYNKLNVLHWHLVDDQSWPFYMEAFPNVTKVAAYSQRHVYSTKDVRGVVEYARLRGIRVIPEIDTPGHTQALGRAFPDALTPCYGNGSRGTENPGTHAAFEMLDPTRNVSYNLVQQLISQVARVFKDPYVHLGMDEVYYDCWKSSPEVDAFRSQHHLKWTSDVEQYYVERTLDNVIRTGAKVVIWQDPIDNDVKASPQSTVVQVWKGSDLGHSFPWPEYAASLAQRGYELVISSCWYVDHYEHLRDWAFYYNCDPRDFGGSRKQKRQVLGGEACMWGEYIDRTNLLASLWPRASAVAERLWSSRDVDKADRAVIRLNAHRCRMLRRGIPVHPINSMPCENDEELDFREVFEIR
ncbi:beta-hexosaminidase subunit beta-like isoform X2 [Dermacentor variabilis]|uniref:beta-hexosaminidase subunit beta-like isoform X2 n=1 Tax=Dermacentor variabilis TaxID=34621 RepID=UPI003F5C004C